MRRWKLYFKFDHLPPHLRKISEPFGVLARSIVEWDRADQIVDPVVDEFTSCRWLATKGSFDEEQTAEALRALDFAYRRWFDDPDEALEALLIAKDCAVRAHLPDPPP